MPVGYKPYYYIGIRRDVKKKFPPAEKRAGGIVTSAKDRRKIWQIRWNRWEKRD